MARREGCFQRRVQYLSEQLRYSVKTFMKALGQFGKVEKMKDMVKALIPKVSLF